MVGPLTIQLGTLLYHDNDRFFVVAHRYCISCSPSTVDSQWRHLLQQGCYLMHAHNSVRAGRQRQQPVSLPAAYNYLTCILFGLEDLALLEGLAPRDYIHDSACALLDQQDNSNNYENLRYFPLFLPHTKGCPWNHLCVQWHYNLISYLSSWSVFVSLGSYILLYCPFMPLVTAYTMLVFQCPFLPNSSC